MNLLDTNIIIRFLTRDHKRKAEKCRKLLEEVVAGKIKLFVSDLTMAEVIWVLEKFYKCNKPDIRVKIEAILNTPNLIFQNKDIISEGVILYDLHKIDFIDAYHIGLMRKQNIKEIYSYDTDFDFFEQVKRKEP